MITADRPAAPPRPWMPAVWHHDAQGLPIRHRPGRPHGNLWDSRCGKAWLFEFEVQRAVMELTPCRACEGSE